MPHTEINGATQIRDATIPAVKTDISIIIAAGTHAFTGDQSMGGHKLINVATPLNPNDAANKAYVDSAVQGFDWKASVKVATTVAGNLSTDFEGGDTIDGVVLVVGDRILIKNQAAAAENGIYVVQSLAQPIRADDADTNADVTAGMATFVSQGTTNGNTQWILVTDDPIVLGTTGLTFTQLGGGGGGGTTYFGDETSIHLAGTTFSAIFGTTTGTVCQGSDSRLTNARTPVGTSLTAGNIFVGNVSNIVAAVAMTGDVTISNAGVTTINSTTVLKKADRITRETPGGSVNGSNTVFTLANTPVVGSEEVYLNGIQQDAGAGNDYTISGVTITMLTAPASGDKLRVSYMK